MAYEKSEKAIQTRMPYILQREIGNNMAGRQRLTGHEDIKGFNKRRMELWEKQEEQTIM